jgi:molybdate transport system substrate-binding protein
VSGAARPLCLALLATLALAGCGRDREAITLAATSSARAAVPDLVAAFERASGGRVSLLLGGSGSLVDRIESGAAVDVVLLGDQAYVAQLASGGLLDPDLGAGSAVVTNRLVLVGGRTARPASFATLGELPDTRLIAVASPDHSAAGRDTRVLLGGLGLWEDLRPRMLLRGDVAAALAALRRGQTSLAVVYQSDVTGIDDVVVLDRAAPPPSPGLYLAVTRKGARRSRARAFASFLRSPEARRIFEQHGFTAP